MARTRAYQTATLLPDGRVLIAGGCGIAHAPDNSLASAELYDPSMGTFTFAGEMTMRGPVKACLLDNGKVLINGNDWPAGLSAELYDPDTGTFSLTGVGRTTKPSMTPVTANLLTSDKVLVTLWSEDYGGAS